MEKVKLLMLLVFLSITSVMSQDIVFSAQTGQQMVDSLLGGGVTATNISYNGDVSSKAAFSGGSSIGFPIDKGILLSSGFYTSVPGFNTSGMTGDVASGQADADLNSIIGSGSLTTDKCVLEFDFVATSDTIQFEYVFGSEEYPDFACGTVNDVFAFLLSGPNPSGGSYVKKNLALIPGTNTFVSVNTVNPGVVGSQGSAINCSSIDPNWASYSTYYNDNPKAVTTSPFKIKVDGFTDIFTAKAAVVNGQTYHIKLAIADVGSSPFSDNGWDSYVFIKAKSFKSPSMSVSLNNPQSSCSGSPVKLTATVTSGSPNYTYTWSNGPTNSNITTDTNSIYVTPISNTTYTVTVTGSNGVTAMATTNVSVTTLPTTTINYSNNILCKTTSPQSVNISGSIGGVYKSTPGLTIDSINGIITPSTSTEGTYTINYNLQSVCGLVNAQTQVTINSQPTITISGDTNICVGESTVLVPSGADSYTWLGYLGKDITVNPITTTTYTVIGTRGCSDTTSIKVIVNDAPLVVINGVDSICSGDSVILNVSGGGNYSWSNSDTTSQITVNPLTTTKYNVDWSFGGCNGTLDHTVYVDNIISNMVIIPKTTLLDNYINFSDVTIGDIILSDWSFGDGNSNSGRFTSHKYEHVGVYPVSLTVTNKNGCVDVSTDTVRITDVFSFYVPSAISIDDNTNNGFSAVGVYVDPDNFEMMIFDRWGELLFKTNQWVDNRSYPIWYGKKNNQGPLLPIGVYVYKIRVYDMDRKMYTYVGNVSIVD